MYRTQQERIHGLKVQNYRKEIPSTLRPALQIEPLASNVYNLMVRINPIQ